MSNKNEPKVAVVSRFGRIRFIQIVPMSDGIIIAAVAFFFIMMVNLAIVALNILILLVVTAFTGSKGARITSISVLLSIFLIVGLIVHSSTNTTKAQLSQQNAVQQTVSDQKAANQTSSDPTSSTSGSPTTTNTSLDSTIPPPGYDTGIVINTGDQVAITASGWDNYGTNPDGTCDGTPLVNPDGQRQYPDGGLSCDPRMDPFTIVQNAPVGELLAAVFTPGFSGTSNGYVAVGSNGSFSAQSSGHLYLLLNESTYNNNGGWSDDSGSYQVTVTVTHA